MTIAIALVEERPQMEVQTATPNTNEDAAKTTPFELEPLQHLELEPCREDQQAMEETAEEKEGPDKRENNKKQSREDKLENVSRFLRVAMKDSQRWQSSSFCSFLFFLRRYEHCPSRSC